MDNTLSICWFRQDLRLDDNPALVAAAHQGRVIPVYILDDINAGEHAMGAASRWWLHHSLTALNLSLDGQLNIYQGDAVAILSKLCQQYDVTQVHWNRCYAPWQIQRDQHIKSMLTTAGMTVTSHQASLLWEPWTVLKKDGTPYKVFTPFYQRGCLAADMPRMPLPKPAQLQLAQIDDNSTISDLALLPRIPWDKQLAPHWQMGETAAQDRLQAFLQSGVQDYRTGRDHPAQANVSRLSPHLHFGEISPNQVWYAAKTKGDDANLEHFCRELAWREFSYYLLYHFPQLPHQNLNKKFDHFPWQDNANYLTRWQQGKTGYPIVDAGMRELWQTGYMHNRVRMIVGSFLVKNLRLHWQHGVQWFWDCLVDADLANNSASWQWVAGCGADAAPYFRIFNPVTQGEKFDAAGGYTRHFVPELAKLPDRYLFKPWTAPAEILAAANVKIGETYPQPIVELKASREGALAAFATLKNLH